MREREGGRSEGVKKRLCKREREKKKSLCSPNVKTENWNDRERVVVGKSGAHGNRFAKTFILFPCFFSLAHTALCFCSFLSLYV